MLKKKSNRSLIISILFLLAFIAILAGLKLFTNLDLYANNLSMHNSFLTTISMIINSAFDTIPVVIFLVILSTYLGFKGYKKESYFIALLGITDGVLLSVLKEIIHRARPVNSLVAETDFSFPSGHTATAVILFGLAIYFSWKYLKSKTARISIYAASVFMMLLIGFSRIYLNVHWLSDVLAGCCLGGFLLFLGIYLFERFD